MRPRFHASDKLPDGVAAVLIPGSRDSSLLLNASASVGDIAEALDEIVGEWADEAWIYVGSVRDIV